MPHSYTKEQYEFIKDNAVGIGNAELTEMFNKYFNLNLSVDQIKGYKKNKKISSGLTGQFQKGNVPATKGKKIKQTEAMKRTQFKKGQVPHNHMPVGSERVNGSGYLDVKIAEPNVWRAKHQIIWEEHHGPIPEGYRVIFADKDKSNLDIDNLILMTNQKLLMMVRHNLIQPVAELTKTGTIIADIYLKMNERNKET